MRTTINIDADILELAKRVAKAENRSAGKVISGWVRKAVQRDRLAQKRRHRAHLSGRR